MNTATAPVVAPSRAGLLRRLAEALPTMEGYTGEDAATLRQMAEEQRRKEEYDAMMRAEVEAALADPRPSLTTEQVLAHIDALCDEMEAREREEKAARRAARANVRRAVAA